MTLECEHGQLARSCNICDLEAQIKEDEALLRQAMNRLEMWYADRGFRADAEIFTALRTRLGEKA